MMDGTFSLFELLRVPLRHKRVTMTVGFSVLAVAVAAVIFWPRKYVSEAKLYIRLGRESVTLDPTTQVGQNITLNESRENEINSVIEVLQSRAIAEEVVRRLGAEAVLDSTLLATMVPVAVALPPAPAENDVISPTALAVPREEKAILRLQKSLDIEPSKKRSNVITLRCVANCPEGARKLLATVISAYQEQHLKINQVQGSYAFFEEQASLLQSQLEDAKQQLRAAKDAGALATVDGKRQMLEQQIGKVQERLSSTQAELSGAAAKLNGLQKLLTTVPPRLVGESETGHDNAAADDMRADLYALQLKEQELSAKFTAEHPHVRSIRRQVAAAEEILAAQPQARTHTTETLNPAHQQLQLAILAEQATVDGLEAELASLTIDEQTLLAEVQELNGVEIEIADLNREIALLEDSYRKAYSAREQSRLSDALEAERISNVSVAQHPTLQHKPVAPRKLEILVLGTFTALFGSFGSGLVCEQLRSARATQGIREKELQFAVAAPVVGRTPHAPSTVGAT